MQICLKIWYQVCTEYDICSDYVNIISHCHCYTVDEVRKSGHGKYYYDTNSAGERVYCEDCVKSIKRCNETGFSLECDEGVIFEKASNSYINCGCTTYTKRLCLNGNHGKCENCDLSFCGEDCSNILNKRDLCDPRECSNCGRNGCPQCVPMVSYESCMKCDPPEYDGQVWKCHNNSKCKTQKEKDLEDRMKQLNAMFDSQYK